MMARTRYAFTGSVLAVCIPGTKKGRGESPSSLPVSRLLTDFDRNTKCSPGQDVSLLKGTAKTGSREISITQVPIIGRDNNRVISGIRRFGSSDYSEE